MRLRYAAYWSGHSRLTVTGLGGSAGQGAIEGRYEVGAQLELRCLGPREDGFLVKALFANPSAATWLVGSNDLLAGPEGKAWLSNARAFLEIDGHGGVRRVLSPALESDVYRHVVGQLLGALSVDIDPSHGDRWQIDERTPWGTATTTYRSADSVAFERERSRYVVLDLIPPSMCAGCDQSLVARARLVLDARGFLATLDDAETLGLGPARALEPTLTADRRATIRLLELGSFDPTGEPEPGADWVARTPGETPGAVDPQAMLERRADGMTFEELSGALGRYDASGKRLDPHDRLVSRASAFLLLHPDECDKLVLVFERSRTAGGRALVLDLLTSTASPTAQRALRGALDTPAARCDVAYPDYLQRFTLLAHPDPESVAFVAREYARAKHEASSDLRRASAYALGATAGALAPNDRDQAERYADRLRRDLARAEPAAEKRQMLTALGNAALVEDRPLIDQYAADRDPTIRVAAARALGHFAEQPARDRLLSMLVDPDARVEAAALGAIGSRPVSSNELGVVATHLEAGEIARDLDGDIVTLIGQNPQPAEVSRSMLEYLRARATDAQARARIDFVIAQLTTQTGR
jgi:hypothetical protein